MRTHKYLAVLKIQHLALNAARVVGERVESDVLYRASLAKLCEMELLAARAHIGHCRVSVDLLAVLHLLLHTR